MSDILSNGTKWTIDNYYRIDWLIEQRRLELMHPYNEDRDENVGGGKMQFGKNEGVANKAIKMATDLEIEVLKLRKQAVEVAMQQSDEITVEIAKRWLFKRYPLSAKELADRLEISRATLYNKADKFVNLVDELISKLYVDKN